MNFFPSGERSLVYFFSPVKEREAHRKIGRPRSVGKKPVQEVEVGHAGLTILCGEANKGMGLWKQAYGRFTICMRYPASGDPLLEQSEIMNVDTIARCGYDSFIAKVF
jgi:hypothetical protein